MAYPRLRSPLQRPTPTQAQTAAKTFITVKPEFDGRGGGGIVAQESGIYTFRDENGNVVDTIDTSRMPRGEHGIKAPVSSVHDGTATSFEFNGVTYNLDPDRRTEFNLGNPKPAVVGGLGDRGGGGGGGGYGGSASVNTTAGGNQFAIPNMYDFSSVEFNPADWDAAMAAANAAGDDAKVKYLQNIKDSHQAGLDLVNTDITGIKSGLDQLIPRARDEGNQDTQTNIGRAGQIDAFDRSRLPGVNKFNRGEIAGTNDFNREQFESAVDSTGVEYRKRNLEVLDELRSELKGKFGDEMLDNMSASIAKDRGAEIASGAGIGTRSGAGIGVMARLDANQRIAMSQRAQGLIPNISGEMQHMLQPPLELAKTQQLTPTAVPLNASNIGERVPIQANISAGSTALHVADTAQSYQAIGAPQALGTNLQNQQYNSSNQLARDEWVAEATQAQYNAEANAVQGGINSDKADQIRGEQYAAYQEGLSTQSTNQGIAAGANVIGSVAGAAPGVISALSGSQGGGPQTGQHTPGSAGTVGAGNTNIDSGGGGGFTTSGSAPSGTSDIFTSPGVSGGGGSSVPTAGGETTSTVDPVTDSSSGTIDSGSDFQLDTGLDYGSASESPGSGGFSLDRGATPMQLAGPAGLSGSAPSGFGGGSASTVYTPPSFNGAGGYTSTTGSSADIGVTQFSGGTPIAVGTAQVHPADYQATMAASDKLFGRSSLSGKPAASWTTGATNSFLPQQGPDSQGRPGPVESAPAGPMGPTGPFKAASGSIKNPALDAQSVQQGIEIITGWNRMSPSRRLAASGQQGVSVLESKNIVTPQESRAIGAAVGALASLADPNATPTDRDSASGALGVHLANYTVTGTIDKPTSIGGKAVVGRSSTASGAPGYKLTDGSVVSQSALQSAADTRGALSAYQVLMSNASEDKKQAALTAAGVKPTAASSLVKQVADGDTVAAMSLFNTGASWEDQTEVQKAALVMQTSSTVHSTLARSLPSSARDKTGTGSHVLRGLQVSGNSASYGNTTVDQGGVHYNTEIAGNDVSIDPIRGSVTTDFYGFTVPVLSIDPAHPTPASPPTYSGGSSGSGVSIGPRGVSGHATGSVNDSTHVTASGSVGLTGSASVTPTVQIGNSPGAQSGSQYGGSAGAAAGSFFGPWGSAVGSFIGSAAGSILGDKYLGPSGKDIRNGWRNSIDKAGITERDGGKRNITLADGTKYDLGIDGGATLKNKDGTDRFSYEVDWTNPVAADSIPAAHLVAIATGLTPDDTKKDSFNRIAGQITNGITSNARSVGDSLKNAKAIIDKPGVTPQQLGMRIEGLRLMNKISEQEYGVYLDTMNKMYGTSFKPLERTKSQDNFERLFSAQGDKLSKADKKFLESLKDSKTLEGNKRKTDKRVGELQVSDTGGLVAPDRYRGQTVQNTANIQQAI